MPSSFLFEAVIFDLDGVITQTALVHSRAWKKMFDDYLLLRESRNGEPFKEFTQKDDYLPFVDGKPRYEGVKSFLESRNIQIPFGDPSDTENLETICGLGNRKNSAFNEVLKKEGVAVYDSTVKMLHQLRENGVRIGVASSSKNCEAVLEAAGLLSLIETRVDGVVSAEIGLQGKPAPDIFITAAKNLGVLPANSIVVEDATSGVAAGKAGNFGLVLGIAREENHHELIVNGADIVVDDLGETSLEALNQWFKSGIEDESWHVTYHTLEPEKERTREALLTIGNGYIGTRGAAEENQASKFSYPGTYIAGLYNRLSTNISGKEIWNEDFVNIPNWLPVTFKIDDGEWINSSNTKILSLDRTLHLHNGLLGRVIKLADAQGRETLIESQRFSSMADPHQSAIRYLIKPLNYNGTITIRTGIDGNLINDGVERYKSLNQKHLTRVCEGVENNRLFVEVKTTQSGIHIAEASDVFFYKSGNSIEPLIKKEVTERKAFIEVTIDINCCESICLYKKVAIYTSKADDVGNPLNEAVSALDKHVLSFDEMLSVSESAWANLWDEIDIRIQGDRQAQKLIRLHLYHLMVSMSPHNKSIDASITARGLHGEAYRGHIFWDEIFILPLYNIHLPETARAMLMYRYHRINQAREYAAQYGYKGAMFPWQSGSDGREETQIIHLNPLSGSWDPDHSSLQRHVSLAIGYNIWTYYHTTCDSQFMRNYGLEMFLEICRFWASKCNWNQNKLKYDLTRVMGPDEFHEQYPNSDEGGINNNTYTNLMTAWLLNKALELLKRDDIDSSAAISITGVSTEETNQWKHISENLYIETNNQGILAQYEGYFDLKELDWELYKQKYGNIYRMDRILKAEGLSPDEYKVSKQADLLMVYYLLDKEEVDLLLKKLGITLPADYLQRNLEYYFNRTSHGSTLSRVVHSKLALMAGDKAMSLQLYNDALTSDFNDIQGGTTAEGIHAGVMAGTVLLALQNYAGLDIGTGIVKFEPNLPENWQKVSFKFSFKGIRYSAVIDPVSVNVTADHETEYLFSGQKIKIGIN